MLFFGNNCSCFALVYFYKKKNHHIDLITNGLIVIAVVGAILLATIISLIAIW